MSNNIVDPKKAGSPFQRYKGVTISIVVFLVFVSGVMYTASHISNRVQQLQVQIDATGVLSDESYNILVAAQSIHQEALEKALDKAEGRSDEDDDDEASIEEMQEQLAESIKSFEETKAKLEQGGAYEERIGAENVQPLTTAGTLESLKEVDAVWNKFKPNVEAIIAFKSDNIDLDAIEKADTFRDGGHEAIYEGLDKIIVALNQESFDQTYKLHWVERIGIAVAMIYFLFFVGFFLRRLAKSDEQAEQARRETDEIMQTVNNGLFLLDKDLNIGSQYSKELERLWGKKELGGKNMLDVLSDMVASKDNLETAGSFVNQLYNPRTKERLIGSLNPLVRSPMQVVNDAGVKETRYLDFKFNRVYQDKEISRVLVSVSDATDAVKLEEKVQHEREQSDLQLEMLGSILKADPQLMADFIGNTKNRNQNINEKLKEPAKVQSDFYNKLSFIFREVHGLKGDASSLGLQGFVAIAENLEHTLKDLQGKSKLVGEDFLPLTVSLEELYNLTQAIGDLSQRIAGGSNEGGRPVVSTNAEPVKNQLSKFVGEIAERNGKQVDFSCIGMDNVSLNIDTKTNLRELAIQLLRNAVVHGIETPNLRSSHHKLATGHLRIEMAEKNNSVFMSVEDDGAGIDLEKIRQKLLEKGMYSADEVADMDSKTLIQHIFLSGFSTRDQSDEDSGRGIGMDIVHERVKEMGGKLSIATRTGAYTRFTIVVPKKY